MYAVRPAARITPLLSAGLSIALALGALAAPLRAQNGKLRDAITRARAQRQDEGLDDGADDVGRFALPPNVRVERDVAYGADPKQRFDVYIPAKASHAPVLFVVHGGGWRRGDKAARSVVENKVAHWTKAGFIVISTNYRLLPAADPIAQAGDLALAVAVAQRRLPAWGGDPDRMVLVGHSAGAHLVALLATDGSLLGHQAARPVIGTLILDSAALNVELLMIEPHLSLYDAAFGTRRKYWAAASPFRSLGAGDAPFMLVCSTLRRESCNDAAKFAKRAKALDVTAQVLQQPLSHRQINEQLGTAGAFTDSVDAFLATLDYSLARALRSARSGRSS
ncbi:MAG: alpha/beta hydrolase [Gemmatimonadetes bacterium]|nr:alpha/beta hydrolase [Gemmatimonadota bacterium]